MKLKPLTKATFLALVGIAFSQTAHAQFTSGATAGTATSGDLILAFNDPTSTDTGSTVDFEVDLGQLSLYSGATTTLNIVNINSDLSTTYGSGYFSNSDIQIGILGVTSAGGSGSNGVKAGSVFTSNPSTTPYATIGTSTLGTDNTAATPVYSPTADLANVPTNGTAANSYDVKAASGASFNQISKKDGFGSSTVTFDSGLSSPPLYLNIEQPGTSAFVKSTSTELTNGYFDINSLGEVQFVVPSLAVPEPSTYALLAFGAALLAWRLRGKAASRS